MNMRRKDLYPLLVGLMDTVSGTMLVFAPLCALKRMFITTMPSEPVYMSFIGAFVMAVGFSYLLPLLDRDLARRDARLCGVLEATALIRLTIGSFVGACMLLGRLEPAWMVVSLSDLALGATQVFLLQRGVFARG